MALISTRLHAVGDYAGGALMLAAANLPFVRDRRAAALLRAAGAGTLLASAATDYELGLWRKIPMRTHLTVDAASGALMTASALLLRSTGVGAGSWLPHALFGVGEIAGAAVTERTPGDAAKAPPRDAPSSTSSFNGSGPSATTSAGEGVAASQPAAGGAPIAPPPIETPGPSVTPPAQPESDVERTERIDAALSAEQATPTDEALVAQQEAAAAAEAAAIGGTVASETGDPAMDPVYQAGGGEQEGHEAAERDLIENATHDEGHGDPLRDALSPEAETDRSTAVYGEADRELSSEVVEDPHTPENDPAGGPGLASERGVSHETTQE